MDSQDFSPTTEEFAGKVYIKVDRYLPVYI